MSTFREKALEYYRDRGLDEEKSLAALNYAGNMCQFLNWEKLMVRETAGYDAEISEAFQFLLKGRLEKMGKGRSDYEDKKDERIARYAEYAGNASRRSNSAERATAQITRYLTGEPIKVGHHSAHRHRRDLERADTLIRKQFEERDKAKYWSERADSAESNTAISSDDPDAITKLHEKLLALKIQHKFFKDIRADAARLRKKKDAAVPTENLEFIRKKIARGEKPVEDFELPLLNKRIKEVKERIKEIEYRKTLETKSVQIGPVKVIFSVEDNRVQVDFPGKPEQNVIDMMKTQGFRWAPSRGCWQRGLSTFHYGHVQEELKKFYGDKAAQ